MDMMKASVLHPQDNVATLLADVESGELVRMRDAQVTAVERVPFGHKIALRRIPQDGEIIKYGESIGRAMCEIREGALVHVHNLESRRGRGDVRGAEVRP